MTSSSDPVSAGSAGAAERLPTLRFELIADEPADVGLRRIALEQVDLMVWHVARLGVGDEHVHGVRKTSKRIRAVMRMVRDALGEDAYRHDNALLRDVARELSALRTATVELEILEGLTMWRAELAGSVVELRRRLAAQTDRIRDMMFTESWLIEDLMARLARAHRRIEAWELPPDMVPTAHGLRHTYRHGRRAMRRAYEDDDAGAFHDWRKRVKYLRHQMEILAPAVGDDSSAMSAGLAELGEVLGLEHDLADLEGMVAATPGAFSSEIEQHDLSAAILQRRRELQDDARPSAEPLYARSPRDFTADVTRSWERWQDRGATLEQGDS